MSVPASGPGGLSYTDSSSPHSCPGPAAVVSTAGLREVMGRNINVPHSWWENEPVCGPEVCILQPTELLRLSNSLSEINALHGKQLGERPRQEALFDQ